MKTLLLILLITMSFKIPAQNLHQWKIINTIAKVESSYNPDTTKPDENAVGYLQIRPIMVKEVNQATRKFNLPHPQFRFDSLQDDRLNKDTSIVIFCIFQWYRNPYWRTWNFSKNLEYSARLWNGGYPLKKEITEKYYNLIMTKL